ncbi:MAG: hypothetical protein L3J16_00865 [Anaerolineales bacterium]|nr:hypothetical protein [Anaerolineales bacterium]
MNNSSELKIREYPTSLLFPALAILAFGYYFYTRTEERVILAVVLALGLGISLFATVLDLNANRITRILSISRHGLFSHYHREIPFDEILAIRAKRDYSSSSNNGRVSYRVEIVVKGNEIVPLRPAYSGKHAKKEALARQLREFIGVKAEDPHPVQGISDVRAKINKIRAEQKSLPNTPDEIHETGGVHWQVKIRKYNNVSIAHWLSSDYSLSNRFLFLTQKVEGQVASPIKKLNQSIRRSTFNGNLAFYKFTKSDVPNAQNAVYVPLENNIGAYFFAYASDESIARQILTPWVAQPLITWAEEHRITETSTTQFITLFSPTGLHLVSLTAMSQNHLNQLTYLGVELVLTQT